MASPLDAPSPDASPDGLYGHLPRHNRLVTTSTGSGPDGMTMTTEIEITFEEQDSGTLMTVVQSGFPNVEMRDFFKTAVWVGAFDRIEAYLTRNSR